MAILHHGATLTPAKVDLVEGWIGAQRWHAAKGRVPRLTRLFRVRLEDPEGQAGLETLILSDDASTPPVTYQVPLTYRSAPLPGAAHALVGTIEHSVLGTRYVYDAPHDPVYAAQPVSYTHLRAHETVLDLVCRLLLEKKKTTIITQEPSFNYQNNIKSEDETKEQRTASTLNNKTH